MEFVAARKYFVFDSLPMSIIIVIMILSCRYTGTRSYNALIAVSAAMDYRESLGGDHAIMPYLKQLAWNASKACIDEWQTFNLTIKQWYITPNPDMNCGIVDVVLPTQDPAKVNAARAGLLNIYSTYIQTSSFQGQFYIRLSAQVYLELSDFQLMARRFLEFIWSFCFVNLLLGSFNLCHIHMLTV